MEPERNTELQKLRNWILLIGHWGTKDGILADEYIIRTKIEENLIRDRSG
jgi:hypothetical protein